jgi:hypothetical protein
MPQEDRKERVDRELIELLNEIRVALPGVQVLFAFLLILPFQQGFASVTDIARLVFFAGLASSALAIAFLITPTTYHRINLRRGVDEKEAMFFTSSRLALIGTGFLAAGIGCSMFVITDVLFGDLAALVVAGLTLAVIVLLWYVLPLRARNPDQADETPD